MPVKALPNELFIPILREAQFDDLLPRYKWLKRYCRVCRAWGPIAQRLLFSQVALLGGAAQCKTFKDALTTAGPPGHSEHLQSLRESVRTLVMVVDHQEVYAEVIALCPNLRELHVSLYHTFFRSEVLVQLANGPRVEALRVRTYHYRPLFQLLSIYRGSVQFLEVDCSSVRGEVSFGEQDWAIPPTKLRELRYTNTHRQAHTFVEWIWAGSSRTTLEVLHINCPGFQLATLADMGIGARLQCLTLGRLGAEEDLSTLAPALRELNIGLSLDAVPPFRHLPAGLVHLSLSGFGTASREEAVEELTEYCQLTQGSLHVLSYHCHGDTEDQDAKMEDVRALFEFCKGWGIELCVFDPPYGHYAGERLPLEAVYVFPRPMPLSSRRGALSGEEVLQPRQRTRRSLVRRVMHAAGKAFGDSLPPVALAKP